MAKRNQETAPLLVLGLIVSLAGCVSDGTDPMDGSRDDGGPTPDGSAEEGSEPDADPDGSVDGSLDGSSDEDAATTDVGDTPRWSTDIHPLLVGSCGGCHAGQSATGGPPQPGRPGGLEGGAGPGKFALDDADAAYQAVMPYVSAGLPEASMLYIKISEDMPSTGGQRMPPALRQWDDASIALVRDWIAAGAHDD